MDDIIQHLKARIHALLTQCEQLKAANHKLTHAKGQLAREKEILLAKHKMAISQIETMVARLKSIDEPTTL